MMYPINYFRWTIKYKFPYMYIDNFFNIIFIYKQISYKTNTIFKKQ